MNRAPPMTSESGKNPSGGVTGDFGGRRDEHG
jgi:hypothetical protein